MPDFPNCNSYWGWAIKGYRGVNAIIKALAEQRAPISANWKADLERYYNEIGDVLATIKRPDYPSG